VLLTASLLKAHLQTHCSRIQCIDIKLHTKHGPFVVPCRIGFIINMKNEVDTLAIDGWTGTVKQRLCWTQSKT